MTVSAGQVPTAAELNLEFLPGNVIKRGSRPTTSTAASGAQGVLRVDSIALKAGRRYLIRTNTLIIRSTVANDRGTARLSMSTSGTATTGSTLYAAANTPNIDSTVDGAELKPGFFYTPAIDETASVLLWTQRLSGTGNITLAVTGGITIDLEVIDCGVDPGDSGTDI